jgi:voltage-gated potassium channel
LEPSAASATLRPVSGRPDHGRGPAIRWLDRKQQRRGLRPRDAAYLIVAVWLVATVMFGVVEHLLDDQTFPTVWLGMWWALQTVTTVGYGDVVPQDSVARAIASFLLLGGLALLSVVTATITSGFVARAQRETRSDTEAELLAEIRELRARLDELGERRAR